LVLEEYNLVPFPCVPLSSPLLVSKHLPYFIKFLEFIQTKKQQMQFSHMENNLWKALHCNATKTELVVFALYAQAISHSYMRAVHRPGNAQINMLNLGPLHFKVQQHMKRIINDPSLLISATAEPRQSTYRMSTPSPWQKQHQAGQEHGR
jgi:hypothetical protein